jgi:hypothetical protein
MSVKESLDGISIMRSESADPPWWSQLECIVENDNARPIVRNVYVLNFASLGLCELRVSAKDGHALFSRKRMSIRHLTKDRAKPSFLRNGQRVYNLNSDSYLTLVQVLTQYMSCVTLFRGSDYQRVPETDLRQLSNINSASDGVRGRGLSNPNCVVAHNLACSGSRDGCR